MRVQGFERSDGTQFFNDDLAMRKPIAVLFDAVDQGSGLYRFGHGIVRIRYREGLGIVHGDGSFVKVKDYRVLSKIVLNSFLLGGDNGIAGTRIGRRL